MCKNIKLRKYFYFAFLFTVALILFGFYVDNALRLSPVFDFMKEGKYDLSLFIVFSAFCFSLWLLILGLFLVPKNWVVWIICSILSIVHIIFLAVTIYCSNSMFIIIRYFIFILSFGLIKF